MLIKNIIFDLGGVIIDIDYKKTSEAFHKLGALNFDEVYTQSKQDHLFDDYGS
jgi:putative hydrolase of the HAD superfamily